MSKHPMSSHLTSTCHAKSHTEAKICAEASVSLGICLVALSLAVLLAPPAYSQIPPTPDTSSAVDPRGAEYQRKDPRRAVQYSVWGTVLGTPIFGPAAGHFYADNHQQAWVGIGTRTGGALLPFLGLEAAERLESGGLGVLLVTALAGGATVLISAIRDIATADDAVREQNRARRPSVPGAQARLPRINPVRQGSPIQQMSPVRVVPAAGSSGKGQVGVAVKVEL